MSNDNVTPIRAGGAPSLPPYFGQAIQEQQSRVWRLRSLLDVLYTAVANNASIDDEEAALSALIEYAEEIHDSDVPVYVEPDVSAAQFARGLPGGRARCSLGWQTPHVYRQHGSTGRCPLTYAGTS